MVYAIRLKTGFFATKAYILSIRKDGLRLSSIEAGKKADIKISGDEILAITLSRKKHSEIEIQTRDTVYEGVFNQNVDFEELLELLKENLHKKIICEYEGGN